MQAQRVVFEELEEVTLEVLYIPGFLGFRECPAFLQLLHRVRGTPYDPQVQPWPRAADSGSHVTLTVLQDAGPKHLVQQRGGNECRCCCSMRWVLPLPACLHTSNPVVLHYHHLLMLLPASIL